MPEIKSAVQANQRALAEDMVALSHRIHAHPELGFQEQLASRWVGEALESGGFAVKRGVADLPTAFEATIGSGEFVVAVCAEYDALPDVGHACGHNVIASAAVTAALSLAPLVDDLGITLKVMGTPAEEGGGGKILMLDAGVFEGVHAAMMVHPSPREDVAMRALAVAHLQVEYLGKTAHASAAPEKGINAGDALAIAQVAIALLRQQLPTNCQVHGITTHGGEAPNVIPGRAAASYYIRSTTLASLEEVRPKIERCFEAGAVGSGAELRITEQSPPYSEFVTDEDLARLYRQNAESLGRVFAPFGEGERPMGGSTDMANISMRIPAIHPMLGIDCGDSVNHQPEFAAHCAEPSADRALLDGGLAMAWTIVDVANDQRVRERLLLSGGLH
ncbi:M20 family metallopeptidase [Ferrimicrobium sp.]|uniref:M20 family metallopeptidase n=1 Tax=Ferrimicrobium sp. TaxID=2926050 RepID=UPI00263058D7|nr:M20 family metallopeptidase [Ferrimicrobium sp.]